MKTEKSYYPLDEETTAEVAKVLAEGQEKYKSIAHIIFENDLDTSVFFEDELSEDSPPPQVKEPL